MTERELREVFTALRDLPNLPMPDATREAFTAAMLRAYDAGAAAPLRVLVTVSGGVAHVDFCPRGVTVEIRDFDHRNEKGAPTAYECGEELDAGEDVQLVPVDEGECQPVGTYRRADNARPEFDGVPA